MRKKQLNLALKTNDYGYVLKHIRNRTVGVFLRDLWISFPTSQDWDFVFKEFELYYPEIKSFVYKRYNSRPVVEKTLTESELEKYKDNTIDIDMLDRALEGENNG